jgi:hypothetical protein
MKGFILGLLTALVIFTIVYFSESYKSDEIIVIATSDK